MEAADFTPGARRALTLARHYAGAGTSTEVRPEHLLLGVLDSERDGVDEVLAASKVSGDALRDAASRGLKHEQPGGEREPALASETRQALRYAARETEHLGHERVSTSHLLLGLMYEGEGVAARTLHEAGLSLPGLRQHLLHRSGAFRKPLSAGLARAMRPNPVFLALLGLAVASGLGLYFGAPEAYLVPLMAVFVTAGWIISVCLHEFGHALVGYLGGDKSVAEQGYLTLNPLKYTHPLLSIILPVLLLLIGAIPFPGGAVYIDRNALRSRGWDTAVSAAGPLASLFFTLLVSAPFFFDWQGWVTDDNYYFWLALAFLALLEVASLCFNLLPIPPLDGFGILAPWLGQRLRDTLFGYSTILFLGLFVVMTQSSPITQAFWSRIYVVADLLKVPLEWAYYARELLPF